MKWANVRRTLFVLFVVADLVAFGTSILWLVYPYRVIETTGPITILNTPEPGGTLTYRFPYCKYEALVSDSLKSIQNASGLTYILPRQTGSLPKGCGTAISSSVFVPQNIPPGTYHLIFAFSYQVNLFRTVTVYFTSQDFKIATPGLATDLQDVPRMEPTREIFTTILPSVTAPTASPAPTRTSTPMNTAVVAPPGATEPKAAPNLLQTLTQTITSLLR